MSYEDIRADFEVLDDWEDRYRYVIELGKALDALGEADRTEANKVKGCVSQVWLKTEVDRSGGEPVLVFRGASDAHIVSGLVAIILTLYSGKSARAVLATDAHAALKELGLDENLTQQRANGVAALVARIKRDAEAALAG
jgi:cysteine desulfuration protein SufE